MESGQEMRDLTLGQLYFLARNCPEYRYEAILELDRRIRR